MQLGERGRCRPDSAGGLPGAQQRCNEHERRIAFPRGARPYGHRQPFQVLNCQQPNQTLAPCGLCCNADFATSPAHPDADNWTSKVSTSAMTQAANSAPISARKTTCGKAYALRAQGPAGNQANQRDGPLVVALSARP